MHPAYTTSDTDDPPDETHEALTKGHWELESHPDGSTWILGPDPDDGRPVLVAACEMEKDARHIRDLHNGAGQRLQELEAEVKRLREGLQRVIDVGPEAIDERIEAGLGGKIRRICKDALDRGGGD